MIVHSGDADIFYDVLGSGPDLVLLHAFPADHAMWIPAARLLADDYRVILPDLRGHGASGTGEGPAIMKKHVADVRAICDQVGVHQAVFAGVSIGGYVLFELWRSLQERVRGLIFCDTRAQADTDEARATRLRTAEEVLALGPQSFLETTIPKQLSPSTLKDCPHIVSEVRAMAAHMTPVGVAAVQRGMAERPDSMATLATIKVASLVMVGADDTITTVAHAETIHHGIAGSNLTILPQAGHLAVLEQPEAAAEAMARFLSALPPEANGPAS